MTIIRKELITKILVEISEEEYIANYDELMTGIFHDEIPNTYNISYDEVVRYNESNEDKKKKMAHDSFNALYGIVHSSTIRYIAHKHEMDVHDCGFHWKDIITASFYIRGNHI